MNLYNSLDIIKKHIAPKPIGKRVRGLRDFGLFPPKIAKRMSFLKEKRNISTSALYTFFLFQYVVDLLKTGLLWHF